MKEYLNGSVWFTCICTNDMCTTYWTFSGWEWSSSVGGLMNTIISLYNAKVKRIIIFSFRILLTDVRSFPLGEHIH